MERLEGYVDKIIYRNEDNGYTVLTVETEDSEETAVGKFNYLNEGEYISAEGEFIDHQIHGVQFNVHTYNITMPNDLSAIEKYLKSGAIKGIGEALAKRIIKKFKKDTLRIIEEEPERLSEVNGISENKARQIAVQFNEKQEMRQAMIYLAGFGISTQLAVKIYNEYGTKMYDIIQKNPYRLADDIAGVGFKIADEMAGKLGIGTESDFRIRSGILYVLLQDSHSGHMYVPKSILTAETAELLNVDYKFVELQMDNLNVDGKVIIKNINEEPVVYAANAYHLELNVARMLIELDINASVTDIELDSQINKIENESEIMLDEQQVEAIKAAAKEGVLVVTGGPGTGKTTTINTMIKYFERQDMEILLAAPTGRAAKRMSEATGYKAQTIHRLLELTGGIEGDSNYKFERNADNPLEGDVIIIDEMSMVDIYLMNSLLQAIVPGTHVILVGDVNQLPSVGPGNVLRDIIESERFKVVMLKKIFRQEEQSDIVINAHKINNGEAIKLNNKSRDFFFLRRNNAAEVAGVVAFIVKDKMPKYVNASVNDIQVLTPMRKGELGVEKLNKGLQQHLNPPSPSKKEKEVRDVIFREGDKVMQIKNNYKIEWIIYSERGHYEIDKGIGIFNGDMGVIKRIDDHSEELTVIFDDNKTVKYSYSMLDELELSYAITIHKAQGSEYPAVVMPLLTGPKVLFNRNLLYTAVTRAKQCVTIVGVEETVNLMINNSEKQKRYSSLALRIKEVM